MRLASVGAPELLALVDEEVVPLASEFAHSFRLLSEDKLVEQVRILAGDMRDVHDRQGALRILAASALTALAAIPGTTVLYQTPSSTRPIRLSTEDFAAFRLGKFRAALVSTDVYGEPREGDVVRLLEKGSAGLTGRDALAEVVYVSPGPAGSEPSYLLSLRPWRGAGTDSAAQAVLDDRQRFIEDVLRGLGELRDALDGDDERIRERRMVDAMRVTLTRALALCGARPRRQVGQTSIRTSSSPSGQDGNVMGPPGKVSTTQIR